MNELLAPSLFAVVLAATVPAQQRTATLPPVADTTIYANDNTLSNGAGSRFFAGNNSSSLTRRALLRFDVAAGVPHGSTIASVRLELTVARTNAADLPVAVHRLTGDWGEAGSVAGRGQGGGAPAQPGDATWDRSFFPGTSWQVPGGDFVVGASGSTVVGSTGTFTWSSTQMAADAQAWLDTPATAFGWILITDESAPTTSRAYHSREAGSSSVRPRLVVNYMPPVAGVRTVGAGCNGGGSQPLTLSAIGNPTVPSPSFALSVSGGPAGAVQAIDFFLDLLPNPLPLGASCSIWGNPGTFIVGLGVSGSLTLPVPNNPALLGRSLAVQALSAALATGSFATSNALVMDFGI